MQYSSKFYSETDEKPYPISTYPTIYKTETSNTYQRGNFTYQ